MQKAILFACALSPVFALIVSLWPLEPVAIRLSCAVFALIFAPLILVCRSRRNAVIGLAAIVFLVSVAVSNWPMRMAYGVSRPAFDQVASQIRNGDAPQTPCTIGLFRIQRAEVYYNNVVCLWTDDDSRGSTGFVQCGPVDPPFNLWSHVPLDESWQFIAED